MKLKHELHIAARVWKWDVVLAVERSRPDQFQTAFDNVAKKTCCLLPNITYDGSS
jgi:hypothetical protein